MNGAKDRRMGSPPRMRGKAFAITLHIRAKGITPAYAGKSGLRVTDDATMEDHPRVCGEKAQVSAM